MAHAQIDFTRELKNSFAVDEKGLEQLEKLLAERIGGAEITVTCIDDAKRKFNGTTQLFQYQNEPGRKIVALKMTANGEDKFAHFEFIGKGWFTGTRITISAREDVASRLRDEALTVIVGMNRWYSPVNRFEWYQLFGIGGLAVASIPLSQVMYVATSDKPPGSEVLRSMTRSLAIAGGSAGVVVVLTPIIVMLMRRVFPVGTFLIGQGKKRDEVLEKIRWVIVSVSLSGLLLPAIRAYLRS